MWKVPDLEVPTKMEFFQGKVILSTMSAGNMLVAKNRHSFFGRLGLLEKDGAMLAPYSGVKPRVLEIGAPGRFFADAIFCNSINNSGFLWVLPGDCPIVVLEGERRKMLIHLSLEALLKGVLERALRLFPEPKKTKALVLPGIQKCCYRFPGNHLILERIALDNAWEGAVCPVIPENGKGLYSVSLADRIEKTLISRAVEFETIQICTCCGSHSHSDGGYIFPSHRRSKVLGLEEARFLVVFKNE